MIISQSTIDRLRVCDDVIWNGRKVTFWNYSKKGNNCLVQVADKSAADYKECYFVRPDELEECKTNKANSTEKPKQQMLALWETDRR